MPVVRGIHDLGSEHAPCPSSSPKQRCTRRRGCLPPTSPSRSAVPFEMWAARCPLPLPSSKATRPYRTLAGPQVFFTAGEADREMARYAVTHGCAALLGHDSDFFVLPVPRYLVLGTLDLRSAHPTVSFLPLRTKFTSTDHSFSLPHPFHRCLVLPSRHPSNSHVFLSSIPPTT